MELKKCEMGHIFNLEKDKVCPYCILKKDDEQIDIDLDVKTVAYIKEDIEPVVGWLVNISGMERGKDYKIKDGRNFVGSSLESDICILGDQNIDLENHFSISYNSKQRNFVLSPGNSGNIVYINKKAIYETRLIENFSLIEIANTKLVFIKFCGDNFSWND